MPPTPSVQRMARDDDEAPPPTPPPSGPRPMCETEAEASAWAETWYASYRVQAHSGELYLDPEGLWAQLLPGEDGSPPAVRLLKLSWVLERAERLRRAPSEAARRALALPRRQALERRHPEAFLSVEEARALERGFNGDEEDRPLRLLSISHAWSTPQHPDPLGTTLVAFADQVERERRLCPGGVLDSCAAAAAWAFVCLVPEARAAMAASPKWACMFIAGCPYWMGGSQGCRCGCIPVYGQGCGRSYRALPPGEMAVFFDYGSLVQKDEAGERTETERISFARALEKMGSWYAHRLATTFSMSVAPKGSSAMPYSARGWTTFERRVSQLIKEADDESWRRLADPAVLRTVGPVGGAYVEPPMHPRAFAAVLARKVFTNGRSDCELVAGLYYDTLAGALGHVRDLIYKNCGWGDEEVAKLVEVLGWAREATMLWLTGNPRIGRRGYAALAAALREARTAPRLETIVVDYPKAASATELRAACEARWIWLSAPGE